MQRRKSYGVIGVHYEPDGMEESFRALAEKARDYTAVFCCSDYFAVMFINAVRELGMKVPDDISVIGFDDNSYGKLARPALTTVHQDAESKGAIAAERLIEMIRGIEGGESNTVLRTELVIRDSVRDLRIT